jgi:hypothetical protein
MKSMKKKLLVGVAFFLAMSFFSAVAQIKKEKPKGKEVELTGKPSCTFCRFSHPDMPCKPQCCVKCVDSGDPVLFTDEKGEQYILLTNEIGVPLMTPERKDMLGGKVKVKGILVKGKGIQVIYVDSMEQIEAPPKDSGAMNAQSKSKPKGEEVTIMGRASCTFCKMSHPEMDCKKGCCAKCVGAGDPPLLTDGKGNNYILLTNEKGVSLMTPERIKLLGSDVTVKGLLIKGKGVQVILVDSMEKMGPM